MITRRAIWAMPIVGALALAGVVVAQKEQSKLIRVRTASPPIIYVLASDKKCTKPKSLLASATDTVQFQYDYKKVSNFHIIFPESPFTTGLTYFDKDADPKDLVLIKPDEDGQDFKFIIEVDSADGSHSTCDPHVIVVKGSGTDGFK